MTTNTADCKTLLVSAAACAAISLTGLGPTSADAASSSSGEEYLSTTEAAPPNILFLIDMDSSMDDPCPGGGSDTGDTASGAFSNPCIEDVANAIDLVSQHFDFARYGVIGTSDDSTYGDEYYPIVPLGSTHAEVSAGPSSGFASVAARANTSALILFLVFPDIPNIVSPLYLSAASTSPTTSPRPDGAAAYPLELYV